MSTSSSNVVGWIEVLPSCNGETSEVVDRIVAKPAKNMPFNRGRQAEACVCIQADLVRLHGDLANELRRVLQRARQAS
jgi:hypothetical protein